MAISNRFVLKTEPKQDVYYRVMMRLIETKGPIDGNDRDTLKQFCFIGVKYINVTRRSKNNEEPLTQAHAEAKFTLICLITDLLALLTPHEFMQVFPIQKKYDGRKYQMRDYFTTIEDLETYDMHAPIGDNKIMYFIWDYHNWDITKYEIEKFCTISDLRRFQGELGVMEQFMEENGGETYTFHEKECYMQSNKTGKVTKMYKPKKRVPKQFKIVM